MTEIPQEIDGKLTALNLEFEKNEETNNADRQIIMAFERRISEHEQAIAERDKRQDEILAEIRVIKDLNHIWLESIKRSALTHIEIPVGGVVSLSPAKPIEEPRTLPPTNTERILKLFAETGRPMTSKEVHAVIGGEANLNTVQTWMTYAKNSHALMHDKIAHVWWPSEWGTWRVPRGMNVEHSEQAEAHDR